jgi:hypothetical protein
MFGVKNFNLNFGGVVGALICVGAGLAIAFLMIQNGKRPPGPLPIGLSAAAGGALGNWIWNLVFPPPPQF